MAVAVVAVGLSVAAADGIEVLGAELRLGPAEAVAPALAGGALAELAALRAGLLLVAAHDHVLTFAAVLDGATAA